MKRLLSVFLLMGTGAAYTAELVLFDDIKEAAAVGKPIHIVTDFSQCNLSTPNSTPSSRLGVFTPNQLQVTDTTIASSFKHFTLNNPKHPNTAVYEFVRYTLKNDNTLDLSYQTLNATTYAPLGEKMSMSCKMGAGVKVYL